MRLPFVPNAALAKYCFEELLPNANGPVHIDLGTGLGHFVEEMAQREPEANWIGLESEGKFLKRAARRIQQTGCENVLLFTIDARRFLLETVPPESLDHVWINFPDPWPKKKHAPRRHTHPWMLGLLISRLCIGGELHLATDMPLYRQDMLEGLAEFKAMTAVSVSLWQREGIGVETKYERKWRRHNRPLYYADWRKQTVFTDPIYNLDRQPPPLLGFQQPLPPDTFGNERYCLKIFTPRQKPNETGVMFIDRQTGVSTPGVISPSDGQIHLKGAWTSWKIELARALAEGIIL